MKQLGSGASGVVYSATDNATGRTVSLKLAPLADLKHLLNEMGLQALSRHKNIVQYNDAYVSASEVCIVMELVDGGCLTDIIMDMEPWPEPMIAYVCKESLEALDFLHKDRRMHRDIKSDNILVSKTGEIKIADFGFAVNLTSEQDKRKSVVGEASIQIFTSLHFTSPLFILLHFITFHLLLRALYVSFISPIE